MIRTLYADQVDNCLDDECALLSLDLSPEFAPHHLWGARVYSQARDEQVIMTL